MMDQTPKMSPRAQQMLDRVRPAAEFQPHLNGSYVIKAWLGSGGLSVMFGAPNTGKTFLAIDMAAHVASGRPWGGCRVIAGPVLYLASEGGGGIGDRLAAVENREGLPFWVLTTGLDLCRADTDTGALIQVIKHVAGIHGQFRLIVLDTLNRAMAAGDENASADMGALVRHLDAIRAATGAHLMAIHHTGKDTSRGARGHSSLRAAVDSEIALNREGDIVLADLTKQRDGPVGRRFAYRLVQVELGRDRDGDPVTTCRVEPTETPEKRDRLTGAAKIAMQALDDALGQHGLHRQQDGIPPNVKVVPVSRWKEMCERHGGLTASENRDTQRHTFNRISKDLRDRGFIRQFNDLVWRCGK